MYVSLSIALAAIEVFTHVFHRSPVSLARSSEWSLRAFSAAAARIGSFRPLCLLLGVAITRSSESDLPVCGSGILRVVIPNFCAGRRGVAYERIGANEAVFSTSREYSTPNRRATESL